MAEILSATRTDSDVILLIYSKEAGFAELQLADFVTNVTAQNTINITDEGFNQVSLDFATPVTTDTAITYTGSTSGIRTPQTATIPP